MMSVTTPGFPPITFPPLLSIPFPLITPILHLITPLDPSLKVTLVPVSFEDSQFVASYSQSAALYAVYQMAVHGDAPLECGESEVRNRTPPPSPVVTSLFLSAPAVW